MVRGRVADPGMTLFIKCDDLALALISPNTCFVANSMKAIDVDVTLMHLV